MKSHLSLLAEHSDVKAYVHYTEKGELKNEKKDTAIQPSQLHECFAAVQDMLQKIQNELFQSEDEKVSQILMIGSNDKISGQTYNLGCIAFEAKELKNHQSETLVVLFDPKLPSGKIPNLLVKFRDAILEDNPNAPEPIQIQHPHGVRS